MLELPWWIMGTAPEDDEIDDDNGTQSTLEVQDSMPSTPVSMFKTPSTSPFFESSDSIPSVVDHPTFLKVAKRRSSTTMESIVSPKVMKTEKKGSFERKETEILNVENEIFCFNENHDETFAIIGPDFSRPGSPMVLNKSDESLADKSVIFDQSIVKSAESSRREFPMFFTSFNDTTVLFNTTITGEYDEERHEKDNAVVDWVFKDNKFLQENNKNSEIEIADINNFKEPRSKLAVCGRIQTNFASLTLSGYSEIVEWGSDDENDGVGKYADVSSEDEVALHVSSSIHSASEAGSPSRRCPSASRTCGCSTSINVVIGATPDTKPNKKAKEQEPSSASESIPSMARRQTPSRKAKTYKSMREL